MCADAAVAGAVAGIRPCGVQVRVALDALNQRKRLALGATLHPPQVAEDLTAARRRARPDRLAADPQVEHVSTMRSGELARDVRAAPVGGVVHGVRRRTARTPRCRPRAGGSTWSRSPIGG